MAVHLPDGRRLVAQVDGGNSHAELSPFDEVVVRMRLGALMQNRISLLFEYWRCNGEEKELVATGEQQVVCLRRNGKQLVPTPIPTSLREALYPYAAT